MIASVDQHKDQFGVEPLCAQLPFSSSSYYAYKARQVNPQRRPARWLRDEQLKRKGYAVAQCTVTRLMTDLGIQSVVRGKRWKTTIADESAERHAMTVISGMDIPSGASHDSAAFADVGVPTAMLFIRNANGSHNPDEAMEIADFIDATKLLTAALAV
ncbi:MAG: di/tripeptidase [Gammaproteobacteria bacterium]|jgi:di/tripeptidase